MKPLQQVRKRVRQAQALQQVHRGVYVSLFCGAGGDTTGAVSAFKRYGLGEPGAGARFIGVNHDEMSIATHWANHPDVEHANCDIERMDPDWVLKGEEITVLWGSAPCQPYSNAANAPYSKPQSRATPTYTIAWIKKGRPKVYIEENVWPIIKKWADWPLHVQAIKDLGYHVEFRKLNAADCGVPQDRRRLILIATRKDLGVLPNFPKPKFSNPKKLIPGTLPWNGADTIIDRSLDCPSIFGRTLKDGRPDDLAEATRYRIGRYIDEQGPFWNIVAEAVRKNTGPVPLLDALRATPEDQWPSFLQVVGDELHITQPDHEFITKFYNNGTAKGLEHPLGTLMAGGDKGGHHLAVAKTRFTLGQQGGATARSIDDPIATLATAGYVRFGEVSFILPKRGPGGDWDSNPGRSMDCPLNVQLAGRRSSNLVDLRLNVTDGVILPHNGEDKKGGQKPRIHRLKDPMPTECASRVRAIATVFLHLHTYNGKANARSLGQPHTTFTTKDRHGLVKTFLVIKARLEDCFIDVGMRMLSMLEQALGQGFPPTYVFKGKQKDMTRQNGNAVPPPMADWIIDAALEPLAAAGVL